MRHAVVSLVLSLLATLPVAGFEIEGRRSFAASGTPEGRLEIISTADIELFAPVVEAFQRARPGVEVIYTTASSAELMKALAGEGAAFDVALSSAMDLQTKLANDGLTRPHRSAATAMLPGWAHWRDNLFAFTREPAAIVLSRAAFAGLDLPSSRQELIAALRRNPDRFRGRVGTYDVRSSGLGYLFATQDARSSESYWRLMEVMGRLGARLYCCSGEMIEDVATGRLAVAYNVLGSYAVARADLADRIAIVEPRDYTTVMLRTALIPATATNPELGGAFVDHLIRAAWTEEGRGYFPFEPVRARAAPEDAIARPIPLGPGLLVFLDDLKRRRFLAEWEDAVLQPE